MEILLEFGHYAKLRQKPTVEGFTHDWVVYLRGSGTSNIQHFVDKVEFHLHESFANSKRGTLSHHIELLFSVVVMCANKNNQNYSQTPTINYV